MRDKSRMAERRKDPGGAPLTSRRVGQGMQIQINCTKGEEGGRPLGKFATEHIGIANIPKEK